MVGGIRNPLSVSHMLEQIGDAVGAARDKAHGRKESLARKMGELGIAMPFVDLTIQVCWVMSWGCDGKLNLFYFPFLRIVYRGVGAPEDGRRRFGGSVLRRGDRWRGIVCVRAACAACRSRVYVSSTYTGACRSTVKENTLAPVWNETWRVKNVPASADLKLKIMDKDEGSITDDFIGTVKVSVTAGAKEAEIEGPVLKLRSVRGTFWLKVCTLSIGP